jgi:hypothetical protein
MTVPELHSESWRRLSHYVTNTGKSLVEELGWGYDGIVYSTTDSAAIKAFLHQPLYVNERDIYQRLAARGVSRVGQFAIPPLRDFDDSLWVLEIGIVTPPFILDFAGGYLDKKPPYSRKEMARWEREKTRQFGKRWPEVRAAILYFSSELVNDAIFGAIYYRFLLRSGPLNRRFGEELVEQVIRGHRSGKARS